MTTKTLATATSALAPVTFAIPLTPLGGATPDTHIHTGPVGHTIADGATPDALGLAAPSLGGMPPLPPPIVETHTLTLLLAQDAKINGGAMFRLSVDGQAETGVHTLIGNATVGNSTEQMVTYKGLLADDSHTIGLQYLGSRAGVTNELHVEGVLFDGKEILPSRLDLSTAGQSASLIAGSYSPTVGTVGGAIVAPHITRDAATYALPLGQA